MKMIDKFLAKVGTDKVLHFLVGALFVAWASMLGVLYMWGALVLLPIICIFKEVMDDTASFKDISAGILGGVASVAVYWVLQLALLV
jgi:hypothetical protein